MYIDINKEIADFFRRCHKNMQDSSINNYLDAYVNKYNEEEMKRALYKAGAAECKGKNAPSLFLSVDEWNNTPYHRTISLEKISDGPFSFTKEMTAGNYLFNADVIQKDPNRELKDWMRLRAMDRDFEAIYLYQDDKDWMMDAPSEAFTNDPYAAKAHGNVITFGLGIGYFLFMASHNKAVTHLTVVERSQAVIDMFKKNILPQFDTNTPITFICADAFSLWHKDFLSEFDYIYADIWQSGEDGLECITRFLSQYEPDFQTADFWIEDSCFEVMWTLSLLHFEELATGHKTKVADHFTPYMNKIRSYYSTIDDTVSDVDTLKHLMYDTETIRHILHIH